MSLKPIMLLNVTVRAFIPEANTGLLLHSPVDGHLGCFQFGVIMSKAAINSLEQVLLWIYVFISLDKYLRMDLLGYILNVSLPL